MNGAAPVAQGSPAVAKAMANKMAGRRFNVQRSKLPPSVGQEAECKIFVSRPRLMALENAAAFAEATARQGVLRVKR